MARFFRGRPDLWRLTPAAGLNHRARQVTGPIRALPEVPSGASMTLQLSDRTNGRRAGHLSEP